MSSGPAVNSRHSACVLSWFLTLVMCCLSTTVYPDEDPFWKALTGGKLDFSARYRFEHVDDDSAANDAHASTIRTTLGYASGNFHGFGLRLLGQDVRDVFVDDFNDATGRSNSKTQYAVVADPSDTDLLEGYISFTGGKNSALAKTSLKLGRQIITYRAAPFHRFMGTVLWRQNWQNHDAFTLQNTNLPDTTIHYAYSWNVNRIFTDKAVASARANFDSDSHFINVRYRGIKHLQLEAYTYLLDFQNAPGASTATYGLRVNGSAPLGDRLKLIYAGEYAAQDDHGTNPLKVNEDYYLGEIGFNWNTGAALQSLVLKFDYEVLTGNGTTAFQTPLATGHAFQGWTDRFLVTPPDGVEDLYFTAVGKLYGATLIASYHMIGADNLGYDYGDELDLLVTKTFAKHYTFGAKVGFYNADKNPSNLARGGQRAVDVTKTWLWAQIKF